MFRCHGSKSEAARPTLSPIHAISSTGQSGLWSWHSSHFRYWPHQNAPCVNQKSSHCCPFSGSLVPDLFACSLLATCAYANVTTARCGNNTSSTQQLAIFIYSRGQKDASRSVFAKLNHQDGSHRRGAYPALVAGASGANRQRARNKETLPTEKLAVCRGRQSCIEKLQSLLSMAMVTCSILQLGCAPWNTTEPRTS